MRPDRIIVGEVRRGEALDLIQSMLSGHAGSLATVHASTPRDALTRLETLCLMSDVQLPVYVARAQVASAIHLVIQIARFPDGSRKVTQISEIGRLAADQSYRLRSLFRYHTQSRAADGRIEGGLQWTGHRPRLAAEAQAAGLAPLAARCQSILFADNASASNSQSASENETT